MGRGDFATNLAGRLSGATRVAVLGIGDDLNPQDRPGILGALEIHKMERPNVTCFLTGSMPENYTGAIRKLRPSHVLMLDAADMGQPAGSLALIHPDEIRGERFSTHAMPLSLVIKYVEEELGIPVLLVGIQPDEPPPPGGTDGLAGFEVTLSPEVAEGLAALRTAFSQATKGLW